jgi:hypothetical protein
MDNNQLSLGGLVIGEGTAYKLVGWNPWDGPEVRTSDMLRGPVAGVVAGNDLLGPRRLSASVLIQGASGPDLMSKIQALNAAWATTSADVELRWQFADNEYLFYGRSRGVAVKGTALVGRHIASAECRFLATDPYYYEVTERDTGWNYSQLPATTGLDFNTTGGLSFATGGLNFGGVGSTGTITMNVEAPGPVPFRWDFKHWASNDIILTHMEQSKSLRIDPSQSGMTSSNWYTVDTRTRLASISSLPGTFQAFAPLAGHNWFWLLPGTNTLRFICSPGGSFPAAQFRIRYNHAFL